MSFDLRVHVRDKKSGRVILSNPYRLHVSKEGSHYERAGVMYMPNGEVKATAPVVEAKVEAKPVAKVERISTGHVQLD